MAPRRAPVQTKDTAPVPSPLDDLLEIVLPLGDPPVGLGEQRLWAEIRKLQLDTDRAQLELEGLRRRERDLAAAAERALVYTFYSAVDGESVQQCLEELGNWSRREAGRADHRDLQLAGRHRARRPGAVRLPAPATFARPPPDHRGAGPGRVDGRRAAPGGDRRVVGQNAFLLVHEVSGGSNGKVGALEEASSSPRSCSSGCSPSWPSARRSPPPRCSGAG